jgi:hypothetical protein
MVMKLWSCTVEVEVLMASDDEPGQWEMAQAAEDELSDNRDCAFATSMEITKHSEIPEEWRGSVPRGDDADDMTCEEVLEQAIKEHEAEALKRPMPNQMALPIED